MKMLKLMGLLVALAVAMATSTVSAQQPSPTKAWQLKSVMDYENLKVDDWLQLTEIGEGTYTLDVKGAPRHELQRAEFTASSACRIKVEPSELEDREAMVSRFLAALDGKRCPSSGDRDWFYTDVVEISGHKHMNEPDHDHLVVLFRACVKHETDDCARTHFVMLLLNSKTPLRSMDDKVKALSHNGLIHGPQ